MDIYNQAFNEQPAIGILIGARAEPTIDETRAELAEAISRVATSLFKDKYGSLLVVLSQPAVNEFLKGFESNLSRNKGHLNSIIEELFERVVPKNLSKRNLVE